MQSVSTTSRPLEEAVDDAVEQLAAPKISVKYLKSFVSQKRPTLDTKVSNKFL